MATEHQIKIQAIAEGFQDLQKLLSQVNNYIKDIDTTTNKLKLGTTFKQASDSVTEFKNNLENSLRKMDSLIERFTTRYQSAMEKGGLAGLSRTFSKHEVSRYIRLLNLQQQEIMENLPKEIIPKEGGEGYAFKPISNLYESGWGPVFGRFLRTKRQNLQEAEEAYQSAKRWIAENEKAKTVSDELLRAVKERLHIWDLERKGLEGTKLSLRNYSASLSILKRDIMDLASWQIRWYGTKLALFLPMQFTGQAIKDQLELNRAVQRTGAVADMSAKEIDDLRQQSIAISKEVPIAASKIGEASLVLGQAGMPLDAIKEALPLAAKMVVATGEDMKYAIDALTVSFFAWKLSAKDLPATADMISSAMQASRLKVQDLATIFNYLATTARSLNKDVSSLISIKDTLTLVATLSQAGVSPSTTGTGLSNAITRLIKMPPALERELKSAGIDVEKVKPFKNTLLDIFKTLSTAPELTLEAIFKGWEIRGGRAVSAILNQGIDALSEMERKISEKGVLERVFKVATKNALDQLNILENKFKALFSVNKDSENSFILLIKGLGSIVDLIDKIKVPLISTLAIAALVKLFKGLVDIISTTKDSLLSLKGTLRGLSTNWVIPIVLVFTLKTLMEKREEKFEEDVKTFIEKQLGLDEKETLRSALQKKLDNIIATMAAGEQQQLTREEIAILARFGKIPGGAKVLNFTSEMRRVLEKFFPAEPYAGGEFVSPIPSTPHKEAIQDSTASLRKKINAIKRIAEDEVRIDEAKLRTLRAMNESLVTQNKKDKLEALNEESNAESIFLDNALKKYSEAYTQIGKLYDQLIGQAKKTKPEDVSGLKEEKEKQLKDIERKQEELKERRLQTEYKTEASRYTYKVEQEKEANKTLLSLEEQRLNSEFEVFREKQQTKEELTRNEYEKLRLGALDWFNFREKLISENLNEEKKYLAERWRVYEEFYDREFIRAGNDSKEQQRLYNEYIIKYTDYQNELTLIEQQAEDKRKVLRQEAADNIRFIFSIKTQGSFAVIGKSFDDIARRYNDMAQNIYDATQNIAKGMENAFMDFFDFTSQGFLDFGNLVKSILTDIYKALVQALIIKPIVGGIAGLLTPKTVGMDYETGSYSIVGAQGTILSRHNGGIIPLLANIPRFHEGGLYPDERVVINKVGERYITREQNEWLTQVAKSAEGSRNVNVKIELINQSGQQLSAKTGAPKVSPSEIIVPVVIDAINRNYMGLRDALGSR